MIELPCYPPVFTADQVGRKESFQDVGGKVSQVSDGGRHHYELPSSRTTLHRSFASTAEEERAQQTRCSEVPGKCQHLNHLQYLVLLKMEGSQKEEWVADTDEKVETSEATEAPGGLDPVQGEEPEDEESKEEVGEVARLRLESEESLCSQIVETVCVDNSNVLLVGVLGRKTEILGRLIVTNIKIAFLSFAKETSETLLEIPVGYLTRAERSEDKQWSYLEVHLKYGLSVKIKYSEQKGDISAKTQRLLAHLIATAPQLPFEYGAKTPLPLKCQLFCPLRCEPVPEANWFDNEGWKRLLNYPEKFRVPLPYLSKNNPDDRLVILSFVYNNGRDEVVVWRTGPGRPDSSEEGWLARAKANPKIFTLEIKNKGIGSIRSQATRAIELESLPQLRESFFSIYRLAVNNFDSLKWIAQVTSTKWYQQIGVLLQEASYLANTLIGSSVHATVLGDSDARTAQLVALCQVLLFPETRTLKGFGELVEREFLQWGSPRSLPKKEGEPDRGTALIQFFDCVFQLMSIYPLSFEFSQGLLIFLAEQIYSNRFGNFLLLSKAIREEERKSVLSCACVWKTVERWVLDPQLASYYLNPFYVDYKECDIYELKQMPSVKQLKVWSGFFFKKFREKNVDYHLFHRSNQLSLEHFRNKKEVEELRKELSVLYKQVQEGKGVLRALKCGK